jgi:small subunit ribosomal protein S6
MQNRYELMLIVRFQAPEVEENKFKEFIGKFIPDKKKIVSLKNLGKKLLAYPIKKEKEGFYWLATLALDGKEVYTLSSKLKLENSILRFLFVKVSSKTEEKKDKDKKDKTKSQKKKQV